MQMPRIPCPDCRRLIAAGPVAGRPGVGRLWRHDEPGARRREARGRLVSCPGSLHEVALPGPRQLELPGDGEHQEPEDEHENGALF